MTDWDLATAAQAFSRPGIDPRQWLSYGTVERDTPQSSSIHFKDENGVAMPAGPLVLVKLHPTGVTVPCRVGSFIAGQGEGTWVPFQQGDEVLVAIPEGDEKAACVILCRFNQQLDPWPGIVAGQDATENKFGFWRLRTPFIIETAESFLIRSAKTGSQIGIDGSGQVFINDGNQGRVFITSDVIGIASGDGLFGVQVQPGRRRVTVTADSTLLSLGPTASTFFTPGTLQVGTSGFPGPGHAVTAEQVLVLLQGLLVSIGATSPGPVTGAGLAGAFLAIINGAIPIAATATVAPFLAALNAAMTIPTDPTGVKPGYGRAGFLL